MWQGRTAPTDFPASWRLVPTLVSQETGLDWILLRAFRVNSLVLFVSEIPINLFSASLHSYCHSWLLKARHSWSPLNIKKETWNRSCNCFSKSSSSPPPPFPAVWSPLFFSLSQRFDVFAHHFDCQQYTASFVEQGPWVWFWSHFHRCKGSYSKFLVV